MTSQRTSIHGQWSSRWIFLLAATGSAVGLGNIWKFPYVAGENGGGAFVLIYIICIVLMGVPIMMGEIMLGRRGRQSPINTMRTIAIEENKSPSWQYLGWLGVIAGFLIMSYYSVIAGWTLAYIFRTGAGMFAQATAENVEGLFNQLVSDPERLLAWHTLFMVMTTVVVSRGVKSGLEQAVRFLMPALFILLLVLVGYAINTGEHFYQGLQFMFEPNFDQLTAKGVLAAMGQAFFSLSLGMGAIMVYGSYLNRQTSIAWAALSISFADTLVAMLAGLAIFPLVFANGLAPDQSVGLVFKTLPLAFGHMPGGSFFGALFFLLLAFAAWTSAISLVEPAVAYLVENLGMSRVKASAWIGTMIWLLGMGSLLSFNHWSDATLFGMTFFGLVDYLTSNIMLPLGGLFIAIFAGWVLWRSSSVEEFDMGDGLWYRLWLTLVRFVAPFAVIIIFLHAIGALNWLNRMFS
ncbi:sodium-dependent transporter [Nitrosococcus wardiae]|uniref:Transporter n=1 Tax=Nitrosococcus wardiae TaxID=1814290 RepID=A0A4P7C5L1_9GAMM|nr:sodium-dependent transporter [Nitrosococcus wardiae]QBQ56306.1 sodium-dependent transporter [Nitrosococcus wardiae]